MPDTSIATTPTTSAETIERTVHELRASFEGGLTRPLDFRLDQLRKLERMMTEREPELLAALAEDLGKSALEGWMTEVGFAMQELKHAIKKLPRWARARRVPAPIAVQPGRATVTPEPLGVVLVITPWNYPAQLALGPLIPIIAAGNVALIKPSEVAPATSRALAKLLPEYLDSRVVRVVEGGIAETTKLLEQRFDHVFYTGNGTVGRIVMEAAAKHLTPVTLELGGKSPCIVDRSANLDVAARRIVFGKFINAGQTCVAPDYILADARIHDALVAKLGETIRAFYGDDAEKSGDYGRIVNERHHDRLSKLLTNEKIAFGGRTDRATKYFEPTLLRDVSPDAPVMKDEIFGPILPIIKVEDTDAAIRFVTARPKPLALYVFSENGQTSARVLERTSAGGACVNDTITHLAVPELPFGGVGPSGMGAYHGKSGFDTFSHMKSVLTKGTLIDPSLRYPPYTQSKAKWIKRLA